MTSDNGAQTDRLFMAIGRVVVQFQFLENIVAESLASILQMREPEDQHRVASAMSFRQKVDLLCDLYPKLSKWGQIYLFGATVRNNSA